MVRVKRAILSCYDKNGVDELGKFLRSFDVEIVSTSGTLAALKKAGLDSLSIADFTGVDEMMDGRVKSLHPKIHAGLLGIRDNKLHTEQMQAHGYQQIDLVVVNLKPLEAFIQKPGITVEEVVEQVDIGGMSMLRSAAKNFRYVTVVVNPERYKLIMHEMLAHEGSISFATRYKLALEAFECAAAYDKRVAEFLSGAQPQEV